MTDADAQATPMPAGAEDLIAIAEGSHWEKLAVGAPPDLLEAILERWDWNRRAAALGSLVNLSLMHHKKLRVDALQHLEWKPRRKWKKEEIA